MYIDKKSKYQHGTVFANIGKGKILWQLLCRCHTLQKWCVMLIKCNYTMASKCNYTDVNDMRMTTFDKEDIIIHMQKV